MKTRSGRRKRHHRLASRLNHLRDQMFMRMANNSMNPPDSSDIVWIGLSEAAGDDDGGIRVGPDSLPDGLPRLHRGLLGNRARIDDTDAGPGVTGCLVFTGPMESRLLQFPGDGFRFKLVDLATEGDHGK